MIKTFDYIIDEPSKVIYLPPPFGSPRSIMAQARDYIFQQQFSDEYTRTILSEASWIRKVKLNDVQKLPAIAVKKLEDK